MPDNDVALGIDDKHIVIHILEGGYVMTEPIVLHVHVHDEATITILLQHILLALQIHIKFEVHVAVILDTMQAEQYV